jgi:SAM-dependent methyltransferase
MDCPLCELSPANPFYEDRHRAYLRCPRCQLVFVPPRYFLDSAAERAEYELHENDPEDAGYRRFLGRLAGPLAQRLAPGARGLDFGCGPGPALAVMLSEAGFEVATYDPFFRPDRSALEHRYDFITATEVVEHLHRPGTVLQSLWSMLAPGGWLGVMTKLVRDRAAFGRWHYKNDPTHVAFFSRQTWLWWAQRHGADLEFVGCDVILLKREPRYCGR